METSHQVAIDELKRRLTQTELRCRWLFAITLLLPVACSGGLLFLLSDMINISNRTLQCNELTVKRDGPMSTVIAQAGIAVMDGGDARMMFVHDVSNDLSSLSYFDAKGRPKLELNSSQVQVRLRLIESEAQQLIMVQNNDHSSIGLANGKSSIGIDASRDRTNIDLTRSQKSIFNFTANDEGIGTAMRFADNEILLGAAKDQCTLRFAKGANSSFSINTSDKYAGLALAHGKHTGFLEATSEQAVLKLQNNLKSTFFANASDVGSLVRLGRNTTALDLTAIDDGARVQFKRNDQDLIQIYGASAARGITVFDPQGQPRILLLNNNEGGGSIGLMDGNKKPRFAVTDSPDGTGFAFYNEKGQKIWPR